MSSWCRTARPCEARQAGGDVGTGIVIEQGLSGGELVIVRAAERAAGSTRCRYAGARSDHRRTLRWGLIRALIGLRRSAATGDRHRHRDHDRRAAVAARRSRSRSIPDIVPPQVSVTTIYPGASAAVVEATVAQPIEAQIVGVDKMIYMKSVPRQRRQLLADAVLRARHQPRHQHRQRQQSGAGGAVETAAGRARQGVTVKKQSSALLGVISLLFAQAHARSAFHQQLRHDQSARPIRSTPGVGDARLFGPQDYAMRVWLQTDRMTGLGLASRT